MQMSLWGYLESFDIQLVYYKPILQQKAIDATNNR